MAHQTPEKNFAAHLLQIRPRKIVLFYKLQPKSPHFPQNNSKTEVQKSFAAHLEGSHGTLVCSDTPVEKH